MTTRRQKASQKAKELKDKLKKLNPSLYNRRTSAKLKEKLKAIPGRKKPSIKKPGKAVPGGPFKPEDKKNPVPGGPFKPSKGPRYVKPMRKALGGEAATSVGRATVRKSQLEAQRKKVDEMLERLYGPKIKPKKKPKNLNRIVPKKKPINPKTRKPKGIGFKGKRD
jgi:hypothetical protein